MYFHSPLPKYASRFRVNNLLTANANSRNLESTVSVFARYPILLPNIKQQTAGIESVVIISAKLIEFQFKLPSKPKEFAISSKLLIN